MEEIQVWVRGKTKPADILCAVTFVETSEPDKLQICGARDLQ